MPRLSKRSTKVEQAILARLAAGESLRAICRDEGMPNRQTVLRWVAADPVLRDQYARARDEGLDAIGEELLEIADDGRNDWVEREAANGKVEIVPNQDHINRSRLRVDARKWYLSKLAPKKYGDRSAVELTGADGGAVKVESLVDLVRLAAKTETSKADDTKGGV